MFQHRNPFYSSSEKSTLSLLNELDWVEWVEWKQGVRYCNLSVVLPRVTGKEIIRCGMCWNSSRFTFRGVAGNFWNFRSCFEMLKRSELNVSSWSCLIEIWFFTFSLFHVSKNYRTPLSVDKMKYCISSVFLSKLLSAFCRTFRRAVLSKWNAAFWISFHLESLTESSPVFLRHVSVAAHSLTDGHWLTLKIPSWFCTHTTKECITFHSYENYHTEKRKVLPSDHKDSPIVQPTPVLSRTSRIEKDSQVAFTFSITVT